MAENTLSSKYNPQEVEAGRYQEWLEKDLLIKKQNLIQL